MQIDGCSRRHTAVRMLATHNLNRRARHADLSSTPISTFRNSGSLHSDSTYGLGRFKRMKSRKMNGLSKLESARKKPFDYTEVAYREAVSKLKYLLAESYSFKSLPRRNCQDSNFRINESGDDTDDRSVLSDNYKGKSSLLKSKYYPTRSKNLHLKTTSSNMLSFANGDNQSAPAEVVSYLEHQEEYIQQLEKESQYCRNELANLLGKVREVIAENEKLHDKNFIKSLIDDSEIDTKPDSQKLSLKSPSQLSEPKFSIRSLEGPSIVYESRISELEAQLTQSRIELKKSQEENQSLMQKLSERCTKTDPEMKFHVDQILRDKRELEVKLEELRRDFASLRERETDLVLKAKRAVDMLQQSDYEKAHAQSEIKRLMDELDKRNDKLRVACQDANRRAVEEKQQIEKRFSQQVEQLSADVASQWEVANKSQMESEKQRREILELKRDLVQKQSIIDDLRKELQNKTSSLQSDLTRTLFEKDAAEQEVSSAKSLAERIERQGRQEQNRLLSEINSYKHRLERADADLIHCRRENFRLSEQISALEKEINLSRMVEDSRSNSGSPKHLTDKELASMVINMESKNAATVAALEGALANQAKLVSRLTAECQSLTQRLEDNNLKHKQEMDSLQNNIKFLSNKVQESLKSYDIKRQPESYPESNKYPTEQQSVQQLSEDAKVTENVAPEEEQFNEQKYTEQQYDGQKYSESTKPEDYQQENVTEQGPTQYYENQGDFQGQDYDQYGQYDTTQYDQYAQRPYDEQAYSDVQYTEQDYANYSTQDTKNYESNPEEKM